MIGKRLYVVAVTFMDVNGQALRNSLPVYHMQSNLSWPGFN